jgi:uridylate kinase
VSDATAATAAETRTTTERVRYQRILLKLSGEALLGNRSYGVDPAFCAFIASQVASLTAPPRVRSE